MIIGLTGYARSGKDTVANALVTKHGYTRAAFADKIRNMLLHVNPIMYNGKTLNEWVSEFGWEVTKAQAETRRYMQDLGVSARKHIHPDVWVGALFEELDPHKNYVISDVRFQNEADAIKDLGGEIWRIRRQGVGPINDHISEIEMDTYEADYEVLNYGPIEHLNTIVSDRIAKLL